MDLSKEEKCESFAYEIYKIHAKGLYEAIKEDKTYLVEIFRSHLEISELNASVVLLSCFSDDLKSVRKLCNSKKKMFISYNNYYKSS